MDPSALIFVALAVAWAVYLIPKALEHHEAGERSRSISTFSHRLRVLGRRDAVNRTRTALVRQAAAAAPAARAAVALAKPAAPTRPSAGPSRSTSTPAARRAAAARATKRRRNVLMAILLLLVVTVAAAVVGYAPKAAIVLPVAVLSAWLVACRLMVRKERALPVRRAPAPVFATPLPEEPAAEVEASLDQEEPLDDQPAGEVADSADSAVGRWDPVDVPLPTYVNKPPAARRTVRTIDLDSTGVWSSGRNEADSALAREADASRQSEPSERTNRKTGS